MSTYVGDDIFGKLNSSCKCGSLKQAKPHSRVELDKAATICGAHCMHVRATEGSQNQLADQHNINSL